MLVNIKLRTFLQQKFGVSLHIMHKLLSLNGISSTYSLMDKVWMFLLPDELAILYLNLVKFFKIESVLQSQIFANIRTIKLLKGYKGFRHYYSLPVSGQRTKTNARTAKRNKKISKSINMFQLNKSVKKKAPTKNKKNISKAKNVNKNKKK